MMALDNDRSDSPMATRIRLMWRVDEINQIADKNLWEAERCYQRNQYKKVRFESTFASENYLFMEQSPLTTTTDVRVALEYHTKLQSRQLGPYWIITIGLEFFKIDQDGIVNIFSINRVTRTTPPDDPATTTSV